MRVVYGVLNELQSLSAQEEGNLLEAIPERTRRGNEETSYFLMKKKKA